LARGLAESEDKKALEQTRFEAETTAGASKSLKGITRAIGSAEVPLLQLPHLSALGDNEFIRYNGRNAQPYPRGFA
jgi:hypothetical protein